MIGVIFESGKAGKWPYPRNDTFETRGVARTVNASSLFTQDKKVALRSPVHLALHQRQRADWAPQRFLEVAPCYHDA